MRRLIVIALLAMLSCGGFYAGSAFVVAWDIREALRTADTGVLQRRVDWASVRQSLKATATETRQLMLEMSATAGVVQARPGLWQRIKSAAAPLFADPLIDRYVTAEGAPQIWSWRQTWRKSIRPNIGLSEPKTPLAATWLSGTSLDHGLAIAGRIDRAAFSSPSRMEFEVRDKYVAGRRWRATFEFRNWNWVLSEVHLLRAVPVITNAEAGAPLNSHVVDPQAGPK